MFKYAYKYAFAHKSKVLMMITLSVTGTLLSMLLPVLNGKFIDMLIVKPQIEIVVRFALILMSIGLFNIGLSYVSNMFIIKFQTQVAFASNFDMIKHMQKVPLLKIIDYNPAYLNQRINNDTNAVISFFLSNFITIWMQIFTILFALWMIFTVNSYIFYLTIIFIPMYLFLYFVLKEPLFKRSLEYKEKQSVFFDKLNEQFEQVKNIKVEAGFDGSLRRVQNSFSGLFYGMVRQSKLSYFFSSLDNLITLIFQSIALLLSSIQIIKGNMTVGQLTIVNSYFAMLIGGVKYYLNFGRSYQDTKASYSRIEELLNIKIETNGTQQIANINSMTVENINFSYKEKDIQLIKNFSYKFKKGHVYTICGDNGSGKSTIIQILLGIIKDGVRGNITYNQTALESLDLYFMRQGHIAVVQQEPKFSNYTVKAILEEVGSIDSMESLVKELEMYQVKELYINNNFDVREYMDKKTIELSGGEKQKIAILKAIRKNPDLLILDEPSSALDSDSIILLKGILEKIKENKIIVLITHDTRLLDISDEIIDLD